MVGSRKGRSFVSARKVAELAGVSRSAVSRTFTDGASVSAATRKKVLEAAETLGYHVNLLARGLIHERSNIVCIVVADVATPYQSRMLEVMTRRLQEIGKVALVINTSGAGQNVATALKQTLNYRADATIVLSGTPAASLIDTCIANGQNVILINRDDHLEGPANLAVDNADAAREALFLLRRAGCSRIVVVSSQAGTPSIIGRERAFEEAAKGAGVGIAIVRDGPTSYRTGIESARRLFSRPNAPDGAFCVTDLLACGFMDAARQEFDLRIPEDLCVVGFDDIEQAGWESYDLTTFRQPIEEVVEQIVALLSANTEARGRKERMTFRSVPVWRKSVRPKSAQPEPGPG